MSAAYRAFCETCPWESETYELGDLPDAAHVATQEAREHNIAHHNS